MTPDREEALRMARTGDRSQMTRGDMSLLIDALAADLEAAERERDALIQRNRELHKLNARLSGNALACDLATAREALERIRDWRNFRHTGEVRDAADAALLSLGEKV